MIQFLLNGKKNFYLKAPRCSMRGAARLRRLACPRTLKCRSLALTQGFSAPKERFYTPMQLVAPSAVTIAVATDAMICIMNLNVSFLVMVIDV